MLDAGARGATTTFAQKKIGDVHLTWENEAHLEVQEAGGELEIVYPPISILAEPPRRRSSTPTSSAREPRPPPRPTSSSCTRRRARRSSPSTTTGRSTRPCCRSFAATLPPIELFPITVLAKDWAAAKDRFFADGEVFDTIYKPK